MQDVGTLPLPLVVLKPRGSHWQGFGNSGHNRFWGWVGSYFLVPLSNVNPG